MSGDPDGRAGVWFVHGVSMDVKIFWADSRGKVIAVLVVLWLATLVHEFRVVFVTGVAIAVVASVALDSLIIWLRKKTVEVSLSSVVTGLLIGLIFDPYAGIVGILVACVIASFSKAYLGRGNHQHIFNPAALGIVGSSLLFGRSVAWWGVAWGMVPVGIIAIGMLPVLWKLRRLLLPITFLLVYFVVNFTHGTVVSAMRLTIDGTVFLFAFVMLPEPKTAPIRGVWVWGWGVLVGLLVFIQSLLGIGAGDPLLLALLAANLCGFLFIRR